MFEGIFPLVTSGQGTTHNVILRDTSGGATPCSWIKFAGGAAGFDGLLVLSGWDQEDRPYVAAIPETLSSINLVGGSASGVAGIGVAGTFPHEILIPPPYALSSLTVYSQTAAHNWTITYGKKMPIGPMSLTHGRPLHSK